MMKRVKRRICKMCEIKKNIDEFFDTKYRCKDCMKSVNHFAYLKRKVWVDEEKRIEKLISNTVDYKELISQ